MQPGEKSNESRIRRRTGLKKGQTLNGEMTGTRGGARKLTERSTIEERGSVSTGGGISKLF